MLSPAATTTLTELAISKTNLSSKYGKKCRAANSSTKSKIKPTSRANVASANTRTSAADAGLQHCSIQVTF
jgi:hypothetical protein